MITQSSEILTELRQRLEAIYGDRLVRLVLFGSQARGDAEEGSDIDVMVVLKGQVSPGQEIKRTGEQVAKLCLDRDVVVCCVFMSEDRFEQGGSPLLLNVRREGIAI